MRFGRRKNIITFNYSLGGVSLSCIDCVRDLGVLFSNNLSFDTHMRAIVCTANQKLGFIFRMCKHFRNSNTMRILYCTLIRPLLEFASVIWSSYEKNYCILIERVQHKFLRRISFVLGRRMDITDHDYKPIQREMNSLSLYKRRTSIDMLFLYKLIRGYIDDSNTLQLISFRTSCRNLRNGPLFYEEFHRTMYGKNKPINRLHVEGNACASILDSFGCSPHSFRAKLSRYLSSLDFN